MTARRVASYGDVGRLDQICVEREMSVCARVRRARSRSILCAAIAALSAAASVQASSLLEIYGTMPTGGGSITADTYGISWRADELEWTLGTYAHSGGALPSGGVISGGGIDAALSITRMDGTFLAAHDNLSATNRDAEIHTNNVTGRAGSATLPALNWAQDVRWTMSTPAGAGLGNGKFAVVSYLPNESLQFLDDVTLSSGTTLTGIYGTSTRFASPASGSLNVTDRVRLTAGSDLRIRDGNLNVPNVTIENNSALTIDGAGVLTATYIDFGGAQNDRSTMTITGTGGIKAQSLDLAYDSGAAITVEQRGGLVDVQNLYIKWVNIPPTTNVSHYYLYGGTLKADSLAMKDAVLHVAGGRLEGRWLYSQAVDKTSADNSSISWESGTIAFTAESPTVMSTASFFGSAFSLTSGKAVELNAPGLTSFVTLAGGKLQLRELADNGLKMNWQSGELAVTGTAATSLAVGRALGDQLALRQGMTLRTANALNIDAGSRLMIEDGGRGHFGQLTNNGELRLIGTGQASINMTGVNALVNNALLTGSGRIAGSAANSVAGRIELADTDDLRLLGGLSNDGTVRLTGGALSVANTLTNSAAGKVTGRGTLTAGGVDNFGSITFAGGLSDIDVGQYRNRVNAKTIVSGAGEAIFYGNVVNDAGSEFRISADSRATFLGSVTNTAAFTGGGVKIFEGPVTGGLLASSVGSSVVEAGSTFDVAGIRENSLTLRGDAALQANSSVSKLNALVFDGGSLDLRNNTLVLDYAAGTPSPLASIRDAMAAGTLHSSVLNAKRTVVLLENSIFGRSSLGGVSMDGNSLIVAVTLKGDASLDGTVNFDDLLTLASNFNQAGRTWGQADFTGDGRTDFNDLLLLAGNFNGSIRAAQQMLGDLGAEAFANEFALAVAMTPEPGVLGLVAGMAVLGTRRRRQ